MGKIDQIALDAFGFAEEPYTHLTRETRLRLDDTVVNKVRYIDHDMFIGWPTADRVIEAIMWRLQVESGPRRRCLAVIGDTGMGKSWIWREVCRRVGINEQTLLTRNGQQPIFYVSCASCMSFADFLGRVLNTLGSPPAPKRKIDIPWAKGEVEHLFKVSAFHLIFFDECQDLGKIRSDPDREHLALYLKHLTNVCGRPLVIMGSKEAGLIINLESHLRSRFDTIYLDRWDDEEVTRAFVFALLSLVPLPEESLITDETAIRSILARLDGNTERLAQSIKYAARAAIRQGRRSIDLDFLFEHAI